eukprot:1003003-Rhodomonas_salina.5
MVQKRVEASKLDIELQRAARNGNAKLVSQLLTKGARVNAQDVDGWTCLHAGSECHRTKLGACDTRY